ncbi:MAG: class I SAM-dependent methyltransferase [Pseudomonadota bacterium]
MPQSTSQIHARRVAGAKILFIIYDVLVLGFSNRFAWKCPTKRLLELYDAHVSAHHLEAGTGTGYFIDHCRFPAGNSSLVLLDLNAYTLPEAARRVMRYRPAAFTRNILQPLNLAGRKFDSVGFNYVLHCLPGTMEDKSAVFENLRQVMNPGAVLFGSTTLYAGIQKNLLARAFLTAYNAMGIFHNRHDSLKELQKVLARHFSETRVEAVGCSGLFVCKA